MHQLPPFGTLAIIPARSGSKGIPHKNIRPFRGRPMLAYSVEQALAAETVDRVIVSTDSEHYAEIARQYGAEVPFLRPVEISGDSSTDLEVFQHVLSRLDEEEGYRPEICVHLRPTYPTRKVEDIDRAVRLLRDRAEFDSVRSIAPAPETPFKTWFVEPDGSLRPVVTHPDFPEAYNRARQDLPPAFVQNAAIDVVRARVIIERGSMTGQRILGMLMDHFDDIDLPEQFKAVETATVESHVTPISRDVTGKTFVFDIDGVIATIVKSLDYSTAEPIKRNIRIINLLYDQGNKIVLCTARGSMTGIDWSAVTAEMMQQWGVKHHELKFGKPAGDFYVDDRMLSLDDLARMFD